MDAGGAPVMWNGEVFASICFAVAVDVVGSDDEKREFWRTGMIGVSAGSWQVNAGTSRTVRK